MSASEQSPSTEVSRIIRASRDKIYRAFLDPALIGEMVMTITLADAGEGTLVNVLHEGIPPIIRLEDNDAGVRQSLDQLAALLSAK
jgi:uncharacterized protein YndB with AHSA1/START domain